MDAFWGCPPCFYRTKGHNLWVRDANTLCALFGIRHAVSQAYHHRANGRAERAGQQLFERLKMIPIETKICWAQAMPHVLDRFHDTPGEGGKGPYQIFFGRKRPFAAIPDEPPKSVRTLWPFLATSKKIDFVVAETLNAQHKKRKL